MQLYLLGYTVDDSVRRVYLEAVDPHENPYRDLKRSPLTSVQVKRVLPKGKLTMPFQSRYRGSN